MSQAKETCHISLIFLAIGGGILLGIGGYKYRNQCLKYSWKTEDCFTTSFSLVLNGNEIQGVASFQKFGNCSYPSQVMFTCDATGSIPDENCLFPNEAILNRTSPWPCWVLDSSPSEILPCSPRPELFEPNRNSMPECKAAFLYLGIGLVLAIPVLMFLIVVLTLGIFVCIGGRKEGQNGPNEQN